MIKDEKLMPVKPVPGNVINLDDYRKKKSALTFSPISEYTVVARETKGKDEAVEAKLQQLCKYAKSLDWWNPGSD